MQIHNLCQRNYPFVNEKLASQLDQAISVGMLSRGICPIANFMFHRFHNWNWRRDLRVLLNEVPVFLVETSQSGLTIPVPGTDKSVTVPLDRWEEVVADYELHGDDMDSWFQQMKEKYGSSDSNEDDERGEWPPIDWNEASEVQKEEKSVGSGLPGGGQAGNPTSSHTEVSDMLGVYIHSNSSNDPFPVRIFVWVDKVERCGLGVLENEAALQLIVTHEYCHALMDVSNYKATPNADFDYNNPVYRFIEEAMANGYALRFVMPMWDIMRRDFLLHFVSHQPEGYREGAEMYCDTRYDKMMIREWMKMKVIFYDVTIVILENIWKGKRFRDLTERPYPIYSTYLSFKKICTYYCTNLFYSEKIEILNTGTWTKKYCNHLLYFSASTNNSIFDDWDEYINLFGHLHKNYLTLYADRIPRRARDLRWRIMNADGNRRYSL